MQIPYEYQIFGQTIKVEFSETLTDEMDLVGSFSQRHNLIKLQDHTAGIKRIPSQLEESFCHELIHNIYRAMDEKKLAANEKHVDLFANLLHQALSTAKYK